MTISGINSYAFAKLQLHQLVVARCSENTDSECFGIYFYFLITLEQLVSTRAFLISVVTLFCPGPLFIFTDF